MSEAFVPSRDGRWEYAYQCIEHVEATNCVLGCRRGMADGMAALAAIFGVYIDTAAERQWLQRTTTRLSAGSRETSC